MRRAGCGRLHERTAMDPQEILQRLRAKPFVPFRLRLLDGGVFDVNHPEMVLVGRHSITLGIPRREGDPLYQRTEIISLVSIGRLELKELEEASPGENP